MKHLSDLGWLNQPLVGEQAKAKKGSCSPVAKRLHFPLN